MIECEDPEPNVKHDARVREMYLVVMKKFLQVKKNIDQKKWACSVLDFLLRFRPWQKVEKSGAVVEPYWIDSSSSLTDSCP